MEIKSNQIIFIGLRSSKDYYKRPGGGMGNEKEKEKVFFKPKFIIFLSLRGGYKDF